jgi:hypothetical protein
MNFTQEGAEIRVFPYRNGEFHYLVLTSPSQPQYCFILHIMHLFILPSGQAMIKRRGDRLFPWGVRCWSADPEERWSQPTKLAMPCSTEKRQRFALSVYMSDCLFWHWYLCETAPMARKYLARRGRDYVEAYGGRQYISRPDWKHSFCLCRSWYCGHGRLCNAPVADYMEASLTGEFVLL